MQIYCTGHSLGGALALLAAYDISRAMEWVSRPTKVICYTFGAPRVGNHAFAHTYNKMVPETWSVVNDQVRQPGLPQEVMQDAAPAPTVWSGSRTENFAMLTTSKVEHYHVASCMCVLC